MKKTISILLCALLVLQICSSFVFAVDDATGLNYKVTFHVFDENGNPTSRFNKGENLSLRVDIDQIGTGTAPLYAMQGNLLFDSYILKYQSASLSSGFQTSQHSDKITFAFLDRTGEGIPMSNSFTIGTFNFIADKDGTVELTVEDFLLTNKDASTRSVDDSVLAMLTVGSGIRAANKTALFSDIQKAQEDLAGAIISDKKISATYPSYWVSALTASDFQKAIDAAKTVYNNTEATTEEVENAINALSSAYSLYEQDKTFGEHPSYIWAQSVLVSASAGEHGTISPKYTRQLVYVNTSATVISIPDEGYEVEYVTVNGVRFTGSEIFTIPSVKNATSVKVTFCKKISFTDVAKDAWFYQSVRFAVSRGLFKGITDSEFQPNTAMTRAMLVTVLYRLEGSPKSDSANRFTDVSNAQWYTDAILWASNAGIVNGYDEKTFGTNDIITREQIVTILYRYAGFKKYETDKSNELSGYTDYSEVGAWALPAMQWANATQLVLGTTDKTLSPKGNATRAQVAAILMRFEQGFME
jgi:Uncharacterised Sugar-binding Domain./S-layer homology domain.